MYISLYIIVPIGAPSGLFWITVTKQDAVRFILVAALRMRASLDFKIVQLISNITFCLLRYVGSI